MLAFPLLLDVVTYDPDIVDLGANAALREYWLDQFDRNLNRILLWATGSATALSPAPTPTATPEPQVDRRSPQGNAPSADHSAASAERSISTNERDILDKITEFKTVFRAHLDTLRRDPSHYGALSLRTILSLREQCLHDLDLPDIFARPKSMENDAALEALPQLLEKLDSIEDERVLIDELVHGILAGNMFDW